MKGKAALVSVLCVAIFACTASASLLSNALKSAGSAAGNAAEQSAMASLTKAVPGVSQAQSALGAGSLMGLGRGKMTAAQWAQIEKAIPGVDKLVQDAARKGSPNKSFADVDSFLVRTGMTSEQVSQMAVSLEKKVGALVPADVSSAFNAALNPGTPAEGGVARRGEPGSADRPTNESAPSEGTAKVRATTTASGAKK